MSIFYVYFCCVLNVYSLPLFVVKCIFSGLYTSLFNQNKHTSSFWY